MKRFLVAILLSLPSALLADEFAIPDLSGGMYSYPSANKIPDNAASVIQNFLTDVESLAVERNGYVKRDTTVLGGTKAVFGLWQFTDSGGNEWIISYSSRTFYKNTMGQTPTSFGPTTSVDQVPDAAVNLGKIWFTNGSSSLWWFDGSSTGTVSSAPIATQIEAWRNRLALADITNSQSTVRFSKDGDGTTWTLGGLPTDPFSVEIGGANDGNNIRCLVGSYKDSMIVGRKYDLWAVDGFDQADIEVRNISDRIGCIEPRTPQEVDGELIFMSHRGIESMNNRTIRNISEPIRDTVDVIVKNTANHRSILQTTEEDWESGISDSTGVFGTSVYTGDVRPTFPDNFSSYRDGSSGNVHVYNDYFEKYPSSILGNISTNPVTGSITSSNGQLKINHDGLNLFATVSTACINIQTNEKFITTDMITEGVTFYFLVSSVTYHTQLSSTSISNFFAFGINDSTFTEETSGNRFSSPSGNFWFYVFRVRPNGNLELQIASNAVNTQSALMTSQTFTPPTTIQFWLNPSTFSLTIGGSLNKSGAHAWGARNSYLFFSVNNPNLSGQKSTTTIDNLRLLTSTMVFTSELLNIGTNITAWSELNISDVQNDGTITHQFGSTQTASLDTITNWQNVVNGQVPTVPTNPFAAFRSIFHAPTNLSGNDLYLSQFQVSWDEGGVVPSPVSAVYDRRYWISFTTSTASDPDLDAIFVWQRNKSWTLFKGIYAASFALWRDYLFFGNSNDTGYVYRYDFGDNDDGTAIDSRIVTKSYDLGQFFREKDLQYTYANYLGGSGFSGSFSLSYDLDRSGNSYSMGSASLNEGSGQRAVRFHFPLSSAVQGREIQYTISKSGTGNRLKLGGLATVYQPKEER